MDSPKSNMIFMTINSNLKNSRNKRNFKAFSLIELSIVILVIGILVAGVYQGSNLVTNFKLSTARSLTQSSPVSGVKNLVLWFETSMEDAVVVDSNNNLTRWKDRNLQSTKRTDAYDGERSINPPTFVEDGINGLPTVRFNGTDQSIDIDPAGDGLNAIVQSDYTLFLVSTDRVPERVESGGANYFLSGSNYSGQRNTNLHIGNYYSSSSRVSIFTDLNQSSNDSWLSSYLDEQKKWHYVENGTTFVHTFRMSYKEGVAAWVNETNILKMVTIDEGNDYNPYEQLISYEGPSLGASSFSYGYFGGDISEFIVFNRALKDEERISIYNYLKQKYNVTREITINPW